MTISPLENWVEGFSPQGIPHPFEHAERSALPSRSRPSRGEGATTGGSARVDDYFFPGVAFENRLA